MDYNRVLHLATYAGEIMLQSGAEIYRVEETLTRICTSYEIQSAQSFVTPTGIIMSVTDNKDYVMTKIVRINRRTVDLDKIARINDLSRRISSEKLDLDYVEGVLEEIKHSARYNNKTLIFSSSMAAGFFTLVFGGTLKDFFVSLFIGFVIECIRIIIDRIDTNSFFINAIGGATSSLIALLSTTLGLANNTDKIVIGSLMLLVPGLAITNAIRDTLAGDLLAGTSRASEAFLIAVAIAVGSGLIFTIWIKFFGGASI
ncbi:threonine/serine exporter family protein [uncultured Clostridium sp.]|uniref:threonine/serine exporter family protein n=1 Tax=uncultured Clostridium sp. TaxID=59620 RepID=UPI0028E80D02|nr:threonine/serine exporter family protein [uncultured Clostridium sp.]